MSSRPEPPGVRVRYRLLRAEIAGYRCIESLDLNLDRDCSVLVGQNATGKSSILDVIQLVGDLVADPLPFGGEARGSLGVREFALQDLSWGGGDVTITLHFAVNEPPLESQTYEYRLTLRPNRNNYIYAAESLVLNGERVLIDRAGPTGRMMQFTGHVSEMVPVGGSEWPILRMMQDPVAYPEAAAAYRFVAGIRLIRLTPPLMRGEQPLGDLPDRYGRDLTARLHGVLTEQPRHYANLLADLTTFVGWSDLAVPVRNGRYQATFREPGTRDLLLAAASDGSVVQAYLAALRHNLPPALSLLLLDGPSVTFFGDAQSLPAELVRAISENVQTMIATHHPTFADYVADAIDILVVRRRPGEGATVTALAEFEGHNDLIRAMGKARAAMFLARSEGET